MQSGRRIAQSILSCLILTASLSLLPQLAGGAATSAGSQLLVRVPEAAAVEVRGSDVIVKVRLDRGVTADLWSAADCSLPGLRATRISANGTYTFPTASLASAEDRVACLATSDQRIRVQARLP